MWVMFEVSGLWRVVLKEDLYYGGGQLHQSIGWGGSDQSVGVTNSPVRVTHKILLLGHFVMQQMYLPFRTPGAENEDLLWTGQGSSNIQAMSAEARCLFSFSLASI